MKSFLCLISALLISGYSYSQKLHAFLFCNTFDPKIGASARFNFAEMHDQFQLLAGALKIEYKEHACTGNIFEVTRITSELEKADITPDDIVVLYINTHGFIKANDSAKFPNLKIPDSIVSAYIKHQAMLKKKPRLLLTIIEACSGFLNLSSQQAFVFEQNNMSSFAQKPLSPRQISNAQKLFNNPFKVIVTAGESGKNTYATSQGSIFTKCFLIALNECISLPSYRVATELNWNKILSQTKIYTANRTRNLPIKYSPVWELMQSNGLIEQGLMVNKPIEVRDVDFVVKTRKRLFYLNNRYAIELTIENKSNLGIDSVVYYLHETMPRPVVMTTDSSQDFIHKLTVWGKFPLKAKVYFRDGKNYEFFKNLDLVESK